MEEVRKLEVEEAKKQELQGMAERNVEMGSSSKLVYSLLPSMDSTYLLSPDGTKVHVSDLEGKVIGLYFSANWYPPCRNFTKLLTSTYEQLKTNGSNFEVIFISSDENLEAFNDYRASMPWLSIPFSDLETKKYLNHKYQVEGLPCLVVLQSSVNEATLHDGVEILCRFGAEAFPFTKERLEELEFQEREKHNNQTLTTLLTTRDRDYLLGHPLSKQKMEFSPPNIQKMS